MMSWEKNLQDWQIPTHRHSNGVWKGSHRASGRPDGVFCQVNGRLAPQHIAQKRHDVIGAICACLFG